jgi:CheY-like chemotaxis protein
MEMMEKGAAMETEAIGRRPRVLAIDDEPMLLRLISRTLDSCEVVLLMDAREALARIRGGERYDLILCDLSMQGMNGMEFHRELAQDEPGIAQRVVFVTGGGLGTELQGFLGKVAGRVVQKPFDVKLLRSVVADFLSAAPRLR